MLLTLPTEVIDHIILHIAVEKMRRKSLPRLLAFLHLHLVHVDAEHAATSTRSSAAQHIFKFRAFPLAFDIGSSTTYDLLKRHLLDPPPGPS
ncbi:hypothetical protein ONZ45_g19212 [Pleurotus djamor]|nr:hypothetical protein ONZ45_g19212 [Pleurotus djamor]